MRCKNGVFVTLLLFFISGCSANVDNVQINHLENNNVTLSSEDDLLDEFEDEMMIEQKPDPFAKYNRVMTSFNDNMYEYVLSPVASGYREVIHQEIRISIENFFKNISYPIRLANNIFQGKVQQCGEETARFLTNTTVGILGLFDPATSYFHLKSHNEDFGQTLGFFGVGAGPHIVLPFFGPSNLRDILGLYPDSWLHPIDYQEDRAFNLTKDYGESLGIKLVSRVNYVSLHSKEYEKLKEDAIDLYPYLRDMYEQYREQQIKE